MFSRRKQNNGVEHAAEGVSSPGVTSGRESEGASSDTLSPGRYCSESSHFLKVIVSVCGRVCMCKYVSVPI